MWPPLRMVPACWGKVREAPASVDSNCSSCKLSSSSPMVKVGVVGRGKGKQGFNAEKDRRRWHALQKRLRRPRRAFGPCGGQFPGIYRSDGGA
eukprot:1184599-Prorocentrum_minimum.AAC.9